MCAVDRSAGAGTCDWEIFNRPDKGNAPTYAFPAIWVQAGNHKPVARVLESVEKPGRRLAGTRRPTSSHDAFKEFPLALDFTDTTLPVKVSLEAFSPVIPHEPDESAASGDPATG